MTTENNDTYTNMDIDDELFLEEKGSFTEGSFTEGSFTEGSFTEGSFTEGSFTEGTPVGSFMEEKVFYTEYLQEIRIEFLRRLEVSLNSTPHDQIDGLKESYRKLLIKKNKNSTIPIHIPTNDAEIALLVLKTIKRCPNHRHWERIKNKPLPREVERHRQELNISKDEFDFLFGF